MSKLSRRVAIASLAAGAAASTARADVLSPTQTPVPTPTAVSTPQSTPGLNTYSKLVTCDFPLVGESLVTLAFTSDLPGRVALGKLGPFGLAVTATSQPNDRDFDELFGLFQLVDVGSVKGSALAAITVNAPGQGAASSSVELSVPSSVVPPAPPVVLTATGQTPVITVPQPGLVTFTVGQINLNLEAFSANGTPITQIAAAQSLEGKYPDSDGRDTTFDAPCKLLDSTDDRIAVSSSGLPPTPPTLPTPVGTPAPSPQLTPTPTIAPTPTVAPTPTLVGTPAPSPQLTPTPTIAPTPTPTPVGTPPPSPQLTPTPSPRPTPVGTPPPSPQLTPTPTPSPSPTPVPTPTLAPTPVWSMALFRYSASGSATLKTLTKGTLPLAGSVYARYAPSTGDFAADLAFDPTSGNLVALGFLPVKASFVLQPLAQAAGKVSATTGLAAQLKVRVKLPSVTLFGIQLAGGSTCQAKDPSVINLKGPDFKVLGGGTLTGVFSISNLVGCGGLNGLVSPLTAGSGNAIALKLATF